MSGAVCFESPSKRVKIGACESVKKGEENVDPLCVMIGDLWQKIFSYSDSLVISGTNRFFREQYVKRIRLFLRPTLAEEKIISLLHLFTSVPMQKSEGDLSDHEALCLYYHLRVIYIRLTRLEGTEQPLLMKKKSQDFFDCIQQVSWRSLGILSPSSAGITGNLRERGAFLSAMIAGGCKIPFREVVKIEGEERIMCIPRELSALSIKVLDVHSQGVFSVVLEKMTVLTHLNLSGNNLRCFSVQEQDIPALQMLDLSHNPLEIFPAHIFLFKSLVEVTFDVEQRKRFKLELGKCIKKRKDIVVNLK